MKAKTPKQVLIAAEWILSHVGWCQNAFYRNKKGKVIDIFPINTDNIPKVASACLAGAIHLVEANGLSVIQARKLLDNVIGSDDTTGYNDTKGRTKEEVLATIRLAIESIDDK